MEHFDAGSWSDFVRGVAPEEQIARMRSHLEEGCATCSEHVAALQAVQRLAANERQLELAPSVVRSVKAMFRQQGPAGKAEGEGSG